MAMKLVINIAKKRPGPEEFSSVQASCSIEGEVAVGQDAAAEAARLYATAEAAVDRQLGLAPTTPPPAARPTTMARSANPPPTSTPRTGRTALRGRRVPPATSSQINLLGRLIERTGASLSGVLQPFGVARLDDLDVAQASRAIDDLKAVEAGGG